MNTWRCVFRVRSVEIGVCVLATREMFPFGELSPTEKYMTFNKVDGFISFLLNRMTEYLQYSFYDFPKSSRFFHFLLETPPDIPSNQITPHIYCPFRGKLFISNLRMTWNRCRLEFISARNCANVALNVDATSKSKSIYGFRGTQDQTTICLKMQKRCYFSTSLVPNHGTNQHSSNSNDCQIVPLGSV